MRAVFQGDSGSVCLRCSLAVGKKGNNTCGKAAQLLLVESTIQQSDQFSAGLSKVSEILYRDQLERAGIPSLRPTTVSKSISDTQIYGGISRWTCLTPCEDSRRGTQAICHGAMRARLRETDCIRGVTELNGGKMRPCANSSYLKYITFPFPHRLNRFPEREIDLMTCSIL